MPLVDHAYCIIEEILPGVLQCTTQGVWITRMTFIAAGFFLLGGLVNLGLFVKSGRAADPIVMLSLLLVFGMSGFMLWRGNLRTQEMGTFQFNANTNTFIVEKTGQSYPFDQIKSFYVSWDWAGPTRMDAILKMPNWLNLQLKDGTRHRIGHGSREELAKVTAWLNDAGLE